MTKKLVDTKHIDSIVDPKSLDDLIAMRDNYKKQVQKRGEALLADSFKKFFDENPDIESIRWDQYAPYFNDGEACVFSVNTPNYRTFKMAQCFDDGELDVENEDDEEWGDYGDGYDDCDYFSTYAGRKPSRNDVSKEQQERLQALSKIIQDSEDMLEIIFGDGARVTVTREGIQAEEYNDHD